MVWLPIRPSHPSFRGRPGGESSAGLALSWTQAQLAKHAMLLSVLLYLLTPCTAE